VLLGVGGGGVCWRGGGGEGGVGGGGVGGGGGGGGGTPIWSGQGCLSEILNLTPKRDQSGRGQSLCRPLKETSL